MRTMTHPDSDQTIEVENAAVPMYQSQGWLTHQDKAADAVDPAPAAAAAVVDPPAPKSTTKRK